MMFLLSPYIITSVLFMLKTIWVFRHSISYYDHSTGLPTKDATLAMTLNNSIKPNLKVFWYLPFVFCLQTLINNMFSVEKVTVHIQFT